MNENPHLVNCVCSLGKLGVRVTASMTDDAKGTRGAGEASGS